MCLLLLPALNRLQKYPDDDGVQKVALAIENFHTPHQWFTANYHTSQQCNSIMGLIIPWLTILLIYKIMKKLLVSFYLQSVPISIAVLDFPQKLNLNYRWIEEVDDQAQYTTCTNHEEQYNQAHMLYTMLAHWQKRYVYNLMSFFLHNNKPEWGICV